MEKDIASEVLEIKLLAHVRDENHRKFQAFALVDAHNPYHVFSFSQGSGCPQVPFSLSQPVNKPKEPYEALTGKPVKLPCPFVKCPKVRLALDASGHSTDIVKVLGIPV